METASFHISAIAATLLFLSYVTATLVIPRSRKFIFKHILSLMGGTYIAGFILYLYGFWYGASDNFFTSSLRAAISALEMFASRNDLIEVSEELKEESTLYMACFALVHFQALMLTLVFIIDIFGKRLESRFVAWRLLFGAEKRHIFIFDGADEKTAAVAGSIDRSDDNVIVFVKGVLDPEVKSLSLFEALVKGSKNRSKADGFENLGHVLSTPVSLSVALSTKKGWVYKSVMKLICSHASAEIFLISWDSPMNSEAAFNLSQDLVEGLDVRIYAGVNTEKSHVLKLGGQKYIHIFNRSFCVVDDLCSNTGLMERDRKKKSLILGFGHTARRCIEVMEEAGFENIDVIDTDVSCRKEEFLCFHPQLREMTGLNFFSHAFKSNDFWAYLHEHISSIHNVIIFGQDKAANYEKASQIARYAGMAKKDMSDFHIYMMEDSSQPGDNCPGMSAFGKTADIYRYEHMTR